MKTAKDIAHERAMDKFIKMCEKHPDGFDFIVPIYRSTEFLRALEEFEVVYADIAETTADLLWEKASLIERIVTLNFGKGKWAIKGIGVGDLVKEDFLEGKSIHHTRNVTCYSVAPTMELLNARERKR